MVFIELITNPINCWCIPGVSIKGIYVALLLLRLRSIALIIDNLTADNNLISEHNLPVSFLIISVAKVKCSVDIEGFIIVAAIVYLSAFSLVIRMFITGRKKKVPPKLGYEPAPAPSEPPPPDAPEEETPPDGAGSEEGGESA